MARIPYADLERVHPKVRATYEALPNKLNIFRMLAHAERNYAGFTQLGGTILARQDLAADLRELAILYIASVSKARYEWQQHVPIAKDAGLRDEQIAALEAARIDADCFDARERLVLRFTHEVVHDVRASDAALADMEKAFSQREICELLLAIGFYMMVARFLETTGVDLESGP
jgi:alkylhydroperoxidase family enzyme